MDPLLLNFYSILPLLGAIITVVLILNFLYFEDLPLQHESQLKEERPLPLESIEDEIEFYKQMYFDSPLI